jgi:hypothetical protein
MASTLLSAPEEAQAQAALTRLASAGRVSGRFQQVTRRAALENAALTVCVHIHDGPLGHGRTVIAEYRKGDILVRRTQGEGAHGATEDWREIDMSRLV